MLLMFGLYGQGDISLSLANWSNMNILKVVDLCICYYHISVPLIVAFVINGV